MEFAEDTSSLTGVVNGVEISLDEVSLGKILDIPLDGIRSVRDQRPLVSFAQSASKVSENSKAGIRKKFLKGEF